MRDNFRVSERGAVSIFIVVFFALLLGVITLSFIGIVIRDAGQSTNNDLSRSAYDSAQAGVEDAKRAIAQYATACNGGNASTCNTTKNYFSSTDCTKFTNFARDNGVVIPSGTNDVPVQGSTNSAFDQAYTCVEVLMNTPDYVGQTSAYSSDVIPLTSVDASGNTIHPASINLNWYTTTDANNKPFANPSSSFPSLPREANWGGDGVPPLMRVQLISYGGGTITDTDLSNNNKTLFLYPSAGGAKTVNFDQNTTPPSSTATPPLLAVNCDGTQVYHCQISLQLGSNAGKTSFLRVTPIYKQTTFQVEFQDPTTQFFDGVQPSVDSTGRANDLFRRVEARVRLQNSVLYPEFAIDSDASFCKDFSVGSQPSDYQNLCP